MGVHGFFAPSKEEHLSFLFFAFLNAPEIFLLLFGELKSSRNKQLQGKQQDSYCLTGEFQWLLGLIDSSWSKSSKMERLSQLEFSEKFGFSER